MTRGLGDDGGGPSGMGAGGGPINIGPKEEIVMMIITGVIILGLLGSFAYSVLYSFFLQGFWEAYVAKSWFAALIVSFLVLFIGWLIFYFAEIKKYLAFALTEIFAGVALVFIVVWQVDMKQNLIITGVSAFSGIRVIISGFKRFDEWEKRPRS